MGVALLLALTGCGSQTSDVAVDKPGSTRGEVPDASLYKAIPLPVSAPPAGAIVAASSFRYPAEAGQHLMFQYPAYTVNACWRQLRVSDPDACMPQFGVKVFRTIKDVDSVTTYTVSTKDLTALPAEAAGTVRFFKQARVEPDPPWMADYAALEGDVAP